MSADAIECILRDELKCLLKDLQLPITSESELDALFKDLDPDGEGAITFDNFYGCKSFWLYYSSLRLRVADCFCRV